MLAFIEKIKSKFCRKTSKIATAEPFYVDFNEGLSSAQVQERIKDGLVNKTKKQVTKSYLRIFYENLINIFNIILFFVFVAMVIAKVSISNFSFLVVLALNISIGLYQDIRARRLIDKLKVVSSVKVNVVRSGKVKHIASDEVVLSDIIEIKQGNQLVCDGTIVEGFVDLNESLLTGESAIIAKTVGDEVYSGSFVSSGVCRYRVDRIGRDNYAEKLQINAKKFKRVKSEILISIKKIFKLIGFFVVVLGLTQIIIHWNKAKIFENYTITKISGSLLGMMPIGMYLLTSLALAVGTIRLAKRKMLTQDMYCIEALARVDTLCLDKTGTLTDGQLRVLKTISTSSLTEEEIGRIAKTLVAATKDENTTANAIRKHFSKAKELGFHSGVPFSSERKYSAVMLDDGRSVVVGAREFIPHENKEVDKICEEYEKQGFRVLVFGLQKHTIKADEKLGESEIIGAIVFEDHIREDAPETIKWFKENGVNIRIITGDNPQAASEIAKRTGIEGADRFISLEGLSIEEVKKVAKEYVIFGRVTPEQKQAIIESLKDDGHVVAMTGDGVNDILALRVADCSIAMASGSDAAKNVSHFVSLNSSFASLPSVVKEGRRVINNLQRSSAMFLVKTAFAIVITILFMANLFKLNGGRDFPFAPNNLILWESLSIGTGSLFLSMQPNDEQIKSKFLMNIGFRVLPAAIVQILFVVFFYLFAGSKTEAATMSILALCIFGMIILVRVCLPFDIYRGVLVGGLTVVGIGVMILDYFIFGADSFFGINYSILNKYVFLNLVISILIGIALYALLCIGVSKLHKYLDRRREEKIHDYIKGS